MLSLLWKLTVLCLGIGGIVTDRNDPPGQAAEEKCVVKVICQTDSKAPCAATAAAAAAWGADDQDEPRRIFIRRLDEEQEKGKSAAELPPVWIGVRLSPLPEVLAAHVGENGLMVANVVKGGPADEAGLERYDVILAFAGESVGDVDTLVKAVVDHGAGKEARMRIIHGGKKTEVTVTPRTRPEKPEFEYKYDEPPLATDDQTRWLGHALRLGPGGLWELKELGEMEDLQDLLKDLEIELKDLGPDIRTPPPGHGLKHEYRVGPKMFNFFIGEDEGAEQRVEVKIKVSDEGETLAIVRDPDGKITVTRVDKDGDETTRTYNDADALEKEDPEAFKAYQRYSGADRPAWFYRRSDAGDRQRLGKEFRESLGEYTKQSREQAAQVQKHAEELRQKAEEQAERFQTDAHRKVKQRVLEEERREDTRGAKTRKVMINIDDGRIKLVITDDGRERTYEFDSWDEFKQREPELYQQFKSLRESGPSDGGA